MKKCTRCGEEYPDDAEVCAIDQEPLESDSPASAGAEGGLEGQIQADNGGEAPEGFRPFGCFDPFVAARLLRRFEEAGIQFLIDRIENPIETGRGIRKEHLIQVQVHHNDGKRAVQILSEDWKV